MSILVDIFKLPPAEAIAYFEQKGYRFSWDWTETWEEQHAQAFTVAKAMRMDVLQSIRDELTRAQKDGLPFAEFRKALEPRLQAMGWWGRKLLVDEKGQGEEVQLGSPRRLRTIYQTNMQSALMVGRHQGMMDAVEDRPYWEYIAVMDSRTRPEHRALHGMVLRYDDPFWETHYPPNGFACRCRVRNRSGAELDREGKEPISSKGRLVDREVLASKRTGLMTTVTGFKTPDGTTVFTDPGFNFNPARVPWSPEKTGYEKKLFNLYSKADKTKGLALREKVSNPFDIHFLVEKYAKENPWAFARGFKEVRIESIPAFMGTDCKGIIGISPDDHMTEFGKWNPARDLVSGLSAIRSGKKMKLLEEYSLESLWHEIGHNRGKGATSSLPNSRLVYNAMETLNQFVARRTYHRFVKYLGGTVAHQSKIIDSGIGYYNELRNFQIALDTTAIPDEDMLKVATDLIFSKPYPSMHLEMATALSNMTGQPVGAYLQVIERLNEKSADVFKEICTELLK